MQHGMDDLVCESDVQDNMISFEDSSSQVVEDVNVCDICGNIGEEEKLAICSRCNDGAEHIYCMQVMIEDIPEGDWFCVECREEVDIEEKHKNLEISQVKADIVSSKNKEGIEHVAVMNGRIKKRRELRNCGICGDVGEQEKLAVCSRCNDGAEHIYCMWVIMEEVPDVGWLCEACQSEVEAEMKTNELQKSQVKNVLFKGLPADGKLINPANNANIRNSKNEKNAKFVGGEESEIGSQDNYIVTQKKEAEAGSTSCVGQNLHEPGVLSIQAEYRKRDLLSRGYSFRSDMEKGKNAPGQVSNTFSSTKVSNSLAPIPLKNKAQPDHGELSKSVCFNTAKIPKVKQLGYEVHLRPKLLKESSSCMTKKVGPTSTLSTSTSFKKANFGDSAPKAKTPMKLPAEVTRVMNQLDSQNVKNNRGTSIAYPSVSAVMVSPVGSQAESTGQYELKKPLSVKAPESIMLSSAKRSAGFLGPDPKRKAVQVSCHSHQDYNTNSPCPMLKVESYGTACMIGRALDSPTMSSDLGDKTRVFCSQDFSPDYEQIASAIPEMDHVWQGTFELWGTGSLPEFCDGLQGHISCSASPKLLDVAKKFPSRIQLQKLPRQSMWPSEFQENYVSIDIFFFARDTQSYEYYYSKLVENIMKDDLALRGNIETVELIIFSSGILPENFQRWNMLYFLWGVLRVKREDILNLPSGLPDQYH